MIKWYAADKMPARKLLIFVSDMRVTLPATSDALAESRRDGLMVFRGSDFKAAYLLGRRVL